MDKREYKNMWVHIEHTEGKVSSAGAGAVLRGYGSLCDQSGDKLIGVIAGRHSWKESLKSSKSAASTER